MITFLFCCLLFAGAALCEEKKSYRGHQVISVKAENEEQVKVLQQLQENDFDLIFLGDPNRIPETEIVVPPQHMVQVFKTLKAARLTVTLVTADLQSDIDAVMEENTLNRIINDQSRSTLNNGQFSLFNHTFYRTMAQVNDFMSSIENYFPGLAKVKQLPYLSERFKNPVFYLELGTGIGDSGDNKKPVIFIEGLAHAREWIVTASLLYGIDTMLSGYMTEDPRARDALETYKWIIIPVVNPDGYEYTWTTDRMWRKNRKYFSSSCTGVDLNRNYDVEFGGVGASSRCRDETYHGLEAFSEAETLNVKALFEENYKNVISFLSIHAYSQLLLYPWGYVNSINDPNPPKNLAKLINVGRVMQSALEMHGREYQLGTAFGVLGYAAAGAAEDWALHVKNDTYAYCYELRPATYSDGGFIISPNQIIPTGEELLSSLYVLAEQIAMDGDD